MDRFNRIPKHLFVANDETESLVDKLVEIPLDYFQTLKETRLTDLYLLPFHPNLQVKELLSDENLDYIKTVI